MSPTAATRAAWSVASICAVLALPTIVLLVLGTGAATPADDFGVTGLGGLAYMLAYLVFAVVGALIVARAPGNAIGPLFCSIGLLGSIGDLAYQSADFAIYVDPGALHGGAIFAWVQNIGIPPTFGLLGLSLLLFPDGRLPTPRWRPAAWVAFAGVAAIVLGYTLQPGPVEFPFGEVRNPLGINGLLTASDAATDIGWLLMAVSVALGGIAITVRFRRSSGVPRQQLKWIALAGVVAGLVLVVNAASFLLVDVGLDATLISMVFAGFPVAAGIAILRYRLYAVDVVINRTLVYGALTATLVLAYVGCVLVLQFALSPITQESELAVAGSTLAVAALFRPARGRIQASVDQRFYRSRYDAAQTLAAFSSRLRGQLDLEALSADLGDVVRETVRPAHVSLWLREG